MSIAFQYMSDLHLELFPGFRILPRDVRAPFLILAGDVGDPSSEEYGAFLSSCACLYRNVFVILGNHEGYGKPSWQSAVEDARKTASGVNDRLRGTGGDDGGDVVEEEKVVVLCNDAHDVSPGVRILGCTLWSDVLDDERSNVQMFMNDYRKIGGGFSVDVSSHMHREDVKWLRTELERARRERVRCVVVTHHAPLIRGTSADKYIGSGMNSAFATDLSGMISANADVAPFWVHGHTHHSHVLAVPPGTGGGDRGDGRENGGITTAAAFVVSNQRGYASQREEIKQFRVDADPIIV